MSQWAGLGGLGADVSASLAATLRGVLGTAQKLGYLGTGPVDAQVEHSEGLAGLIVALLQELAGKGVSDAELLDLGSGGGLPGLVLLVRIPGVHIALIESSARRAGFLRWALRELAAQDRTIADRAAVLEEHAENLGHDPRFRESRDVVTARAFGPPAVTLECAAPLARTGGALVISGAPGDAARPHRGPAQPLGLSPRSGRRLTGNPVPPDIAEALGVSGPETVLARSFHFAVYRKVRPCAMVYPRKVGMPRKRPLFGVSRETTGLA